MYNIEKIFGRETDPSTFRFGLSPLHAWIKFFEFLLHVSYRLDFKKLQAKIPAEKASVKERKTKI